MTRTARRQAFVPGNVAFAIATVLLATLVPVVHAADSSTFNVVSANAPTSTSLEVTFDADPDATQAATLSNFDVPGLTLSGTPVVSGTTVTITTSAQTAFQGYTVTVSNVTRAADAVPLTTDSATFSWGVIDVCVVAIQFDPTSIDFGSVDVGATSSSTVTVTLDSTFCGEDVTVGQVTISGANSGDFSLSNDGCSLVTLHGLGDSCPIEVTFAPSAVGAASAALDVTTTPASVLPGNPPLQVGLGGTGAAGGGGSASADVSIAVSGPDSGARRTDASYSITVENLGVDPAHHVVMTVVIPTGTRLVSISGFSCARVDRIVTCDLGDVASGATVSGTIILSLGGKTGRSVTLASTAESTADTGGDATPDPDESNNTSSATTLIVR